MSHPYAPPPSRVLALLALAGLAVWALLTVQVGAASVANAVNTVRTTTHLEEGLWISAVSFTVGFSSFVLWLLSLNVVLVAAVLGVVDIAVTQRSWRRCVVFAAVAVGSPVTAVVISQVGNEIDDPFRTSYVDAVSPGLAMSAIAVATVLVACWLLGLWPGRLSRTPGAPRRPTSAPPASTTV